MKGVKITEGSENVFIDLGFDEVEAAELTLKSCLLGHIRTVFCESGLTQVEIGRKLTIDQPRVSKLLNGQIGKFSVETLVGYLLKLGHNVNVEVVPASKKGKLGKVRTVISGPKRKMSASQRRATAC